MQVFAGFFAAVTTLWSRVPMTIQDAYTVAALFWMLDTVSGVGKAGAEGKLRSRALYQGIVAKGVMFSLIFGIFAGLALLTRQSLCLLAPASIIIATESISIIENIYWWEKFGGRKLPPAVHSVLKAVLDRFGKYLDVANLNTQETIIKTVIVPDTAPLIVDPVGVRNTE